MDFHYDIDFIFPNDEHPFDSSSSNDEWEFLSLHGKGGKGYTSILYYLVVGHCEFTISTSS